MIHRVPHLHVFDDSPLVITLDSADSVGLERDTGSIDGSCHDVIPVSANLTLENDAIEHVDRIGHVVDLHVEPQASHADVVGGGVEPGGVSNSGGGVTADLSGKEVVLGGEADASPQPRQGGVSSDADGLRQATHVTGGASAVRRVD